MKVKLLSIFLACLAVVRLHGQSSVSGTVTDEKQQPLIGAVIACFANNDNRLLRGSVADEAGKFRLEVDWQSEWVQISYLGYESRNYKAAAEMPAMIVLTPASKEVGEVVVQGKSMITQKSDRLIFSVSNSALTKGNNTAQLLRFTPLMDIQGDQINMMGKNGIQLYIDGRKSNLTGEAMRSYLQGLPAEKIQRIELITNPGSEYRVGPNQGILNLILKKDERQGWKGTLSLTDSWRIYNSYNGNLYLNYQKNKLALSASAYGRKNRARYDKTTRYEYLSGGLSNDIEEVTRLKHRSGGASVTMDYRLSDTRTFGTMVDVFYARRANDLYTRTQYGQLQPFTLDSTVYAPNLGDATQWSVSANVNYRRTIGKKGNRFTVDLDYLRTDNRNDELLDYSRVQGGITGAPYLRFSQDRDEVFDTYSGKAEYQHVFTSSQRLTAGAETYYLSGYNRFFHGDYRNGTYISDPQKSNRFDMEETYASVYATWMSRWNKKFTTVAALRGEYVYRHGRQAAGADKVTRREFAALPSVAVNYYAGRNHQLSYALSTTVIRPMLVSLNPFRYYISPTVYRENNPDLPSPYQLNMSLSYVFKQHYIAQMGYVTGKGITGFYTPAEEGYTKWTTEAYGRSSSGFFMLNWNDSFFNDRFTLNAMVYGMYSWAHGGFDDYTIDLSDFSWFGSLDMNVALSKRYNWNTDVKFRYHSRSEQAEYESNASYDLSLGVRKVFKNDISINFGCDFLLYRNSERTFFTENYRSYNHSDTDFRRYYIRISIPFGRKKVAAVNERAGVTKRVKGRVSTQSNQ